MLNEKDKKGLEKAWTEGQMDMCFKILAQYNLLPQCGTCSQSSALSEFIISEIEQKRLFQNEQND